MGCCGERYETDASMIWADFELVGEVGDKGELFSEVGGPFATGPIQNKHYVSWLEWAC